MDSTKVLQGNWEEVIASYSKGIYWVEGEDLLGVKVRDNIISGEEKHESPWIWL